MKKTIIAILCNKNIQTYLFLIYKNDIISKIILQTVFVHKSSNMKNLSTPLLFIVLKLNDY